MAETLADKAPAKGKIIYQTEFPNDHPKRRQEKIGVLVLNLGTPEGTSYWPMRRYLKEFLSDRRVIDYNPILWQIILNGIILMRRPKKSGEAYHEIWNHEKGESPLKTITREQAEGVQQALRERHGENVIVDWGMRYGYPRTEDAIHRLQEQGCTRILFFALYPQYAAATTATAYDKAFQALMKMRWQPAIRTAPAYHDEPVYIRAVADSIRAHLDTLDWEPEVILTSFHGIPKRYHRLGDPYHCHCAKTSRLIRDELGWSPERFKLTFQSRFGPEEWLQPYTDETIEALAKQGVKKLAIVAPGFSADCLETLEELDMQGRESFESNGGEKFSYIPCLNASQDSVEMIAELASRELDGWLESEVPAVQLGKRFASVG